jgi:hypothetical protein
MKGLLRFLTELLPSKQSVGHASVHGRPCQMLLDPGGALSGPQRTAAREEFICVPKTLSALGVLNSKGIPF